MHPLNPAAPPCANRFAATYGRRSMRNHYAPWSVLLVALFGGASAASAAPITVTDVFDILDVSSMNDIGFRTVPVLFVGANQVTPNGTNGTTGTAQTTSTLTGTTVTISLPFRGDTAFPNQISTGLGGGAPADNPGLHGSWMLTFTNGSDSTVVTTPSLVGVTPIPLASNVTVSPGTNPTFTWTNPTGAGGQFINILDKDIRTLSGGFDDVLNRGLPAGSTTFTVPTALAGGLTLDPTHHYAIEISEVQFRSTPLCTPGPLCTHANEQAISRAIIDFTVVPSGAPPAVYLPFVDPSGVYHFDMTVIAGQTFFIDPAVAIGYDYAIGPGDPNFASALFPNVGGGSFQLFDCSGASLGTASAGTPFSFGPSGIGCFRLRGIAPSAGLDPADTTAFITGLTFTGPGEFTGTMSPLIASIPEPGTFLLVGTGLAGVGGLAWRRARPK